MTFENNKKLALTKQDKSHIGGVDEAIKPLCDLINSSDDYYTTSSCSGRIVLMNEPKDHNKDEAKWLFVSHEVVEFDSIEKIISSLPQNEVWFREEGMIIHIACRTNKDAFALVNAAREMGLKRSGVISSKNKIIVEILDTEKLELPIAVEGRLVVDQEYLKLVLKLANKKLEKTRKKIKKLEEKFSNLFSSCLS